MRKVDLANRRFGRVTVTGPSPKRGQRGEAFWFVICDCGESCEVQGTLLTNGNTKSCGCLRTENAAALFKTHGLSKTPEYNIWCTMKARCKDLGDKRYGGRGISVCESWANSFESFIESMGPRPSSGHSIDRIDPDGNYEPANCRWATLEEQSTNKRNTLRLTLDGVTRTVREWASVTGIPYDTIKARVRNYGWSPEEALTIPVIRNHYRRTRLGQKNR